MKPDLYKSAHSIHGNLALTIALENLKFRIVDTIYIIVQYILNIAQHNKELDFESPHYTKFTLYRDILSE